MSAFDPPRPGSVPTQPLQLAMASIPKEGGFTVRFLANYTGVLIHYPKAGATPCPGPKECPVNIHSARTVWKAYAPAEVWRDHPASDWLPVVLEVTEKLDELLAGLTLRGRVWFLTRQIGRHRHQECVGHEVDHLGATELPLAFDVRGVVMRVYRTSRIAFDVRSPLPPRVQIEPSSGYIPPTALPVPPSPEEVAKINAANAVETRRLLAAALGRTPTKEAPK